MNSQTSTSTSVMINVSTSASLIHAIDKNQYFIKDLGLGSGTFLRTLITAHSALRNGQIVIFGENQMVVGITHGKNRQGTDKQ
jgi:hypothetical protein